MSDISKKPKDHLGGYFGAEEAEFLLFEKESFRKCFDTLRKHVQRVATARSLESKAAEGCSKPEKLQGLYAVQGFLNKQNLLADFSKVCVLNKISHIQKIVSHWEYFCDSIFLVYFQEAWPVAKNLLYLNGEIEQALEKMLEHLKDSCNPRNVNMPEDPKAASIYFFKAEGLEEGLVLKCKMLRAMPAHISEQSRATVALTRGAGMEKVQKKKKAIKKRKGEILLEDVLGFFKKADQHIHEYSKRANQLRMAEQVLKAFEEESFFVCEAPTGTGKSLAYLLPAVLHTMEQGEVLVIATQNHVLQEQLTRKDIPLLKKIIDKKLPEIAIVKGKSNYLCWQKYLDTLAKGEYHGDLFEGPGQAKQLEEIHAWCQQTETGDFSELYRPPPKDVLQSLCAENDACRLSLCQHKNKCFYGRAREKISKAKLFVVNHHILCADLAMKGNKAGGEALLPAYSRLIVDEAHHLEEALRSYFAKGFTEYDVRQTLEQIGYQRNFGGNLRSNRAGKPRALHRGSIFGELSRRLLKFQNESASRKKTIDALRLSKEVLRIKEEFFKVAEGYIKRSSPIFDEIQRVLHGSMPKAAAATVAVAAKGIGGNLAAAKQDPASGESRFEIKLRIHDAMKTGELWQEHLQALLRNLMLLLDELSQSLLPLGRLLDDSTTETFELERQRMHVSSYANRLLGFQENMARLLADNEENEVKWISAPAFNKASSSNKHMTGNVAFVDKGKGKALGFHISPIKVSSEIAQQLFMNLKTAVFTSATLAIGESGDKRFKFFKNSLSLQELEGKKLFELKLEPHFNYSKHCVLYRPRDFLDFRDKGFMQEVAKVIVRVGQFFEGKTMVLFTSYSMLRKVAALVLPQLAKLDIKLLFQGLHSRTAMIEEIQSSPRCVLLGVNSLWEGVDVRGQNISCIIIVKLPFESPADPVFEARSEEIKKNGGDSFMEYSLPKAILRFKQGFGRLIRTENDKGICVVLDKRLRTKRYGKAFLSSLPKLREFEHGDFESAAKVLF